MVVSPVTLATPADGSARPTQHAAVSNQFESADICQSDVVDYQMAAVCEEGDRSGPARALNEKIRNHQSDASKSVSAAGSGFVVLETNAKPYSPLSPCSLPPAAGASSSSPSGRALLSSRLTSLS